MGRGPAGFAAFKSPSVQNANIATRTRCTLQQCAAYLQSTDVAEPVYHKKCLVAAKLLLVFSRFWMELRSGFKARHDNTLTS